MAPSSESDKLKIVSIGERVASLENERGHVTRSIDALSTKVDQVHLLVSDLNVRAAKNDMNWRWMSKIHGAIGGAFALLAQFLLGKIFK